MEPKPIRVMNIIQCDHGFMLTLHPEANTKNDADTQKKDIAHDYPSLFARIEEFFKMQALEIKSDSENEPDNT